MPTMDSNSDSESEISVPNRRVTVEYDIDDEVEEPLPFDSAADADEDEVIEKEEIMFLNKAKNMIWSSKYHPTGWNETRNKFQQTNGSFIINPASIRSPRDAFTEFVDGEMVQRIVDFTNAEALAAGDTLFKPVSEDELLAWLACSINAGLMGSNHTSLNALWTSDSVYGMVFFRAVMSLKRYQGINRYIRFDDSVARRIPRQIGQDSASSYKKSADRLALVRPVVEIFHKNFCEKYIPGENIAVDERIVSFRGRVIFRVYSKGKPDPYGIKIFGLSDAANAYFSNFEIYTGKSKS